MVKISFALKLGSLNCIEYRDRSELPLMQKIIQKFENQSMLNN